MMMRQLANPNYKQATEWPASQARGAYHFASQEERAIVLAQTQEEEGTMGWKNDPQRVEYDAELEQLAAAMPKARGTCDVLQQAVRRLERIPNRADRDSLLAALRWRYA